MNVELCLRPGDILGKKGGLALLDLVASAKCLVASEGTLQLLGKVPVAKPTMFAKGLPEVIAKVS